MTFFLLAGSALGAVTAGFFAAAGAHFGVLLSPVTVLAAGGGIGACAFDGRCRQPGTGTKRPRDLKDGEPGFPTRPHRRSRRAYGGRRRVAYDEQAKVSRVVKPALSRPGFGADARASILRARAPSVPRPFPKARSCARCFTSPVKPPVASSRRRILRTAAADVDVAAVTEEYDGARRVYGALGVVRRSGGGMPSSERHAACAIDVRGLFAVLSYRRVMSGVSIDELYWKRRPSRFRCCAE